MCKTVCNEKAEYIYSVSIVLKWVLHAINKEYNHVLCTLSKFHELSTVRVAL